MRLKSAFTLLLTCVTISNALAVEEQEPETKQTVLAVCFETSLLAREYHSCGRHPKQYRKDSFAVVGAPPPNL